MQHASTHFLNMSREEVLRQSRIDEAMIVAERAAAFRDTALARDLEAGALLVAQAEAAPQTVHVADWRIACFDIASGVSSVLDAREAKWTKSELTAKQAKALRDGEFISVDGRVIWYADLGRDYVQDAATESRIAARKAERAARPRTEWKEDAMPTPKRNWRMGFTDEQLEDGDAKCDERMGN